MRAVILTTNGDVLNDGWGAILRTTDGIDAILVCVQRPPGGLKAVATRFKKNVIKHGILFIPYRVWAVFAERPRHLIPETRSAQRDLPVETITASSIHSDDVLRAVRDWAPDIGISIGAPVLREPLFTIPRYGTVNIHCGEVPAFRGAPPAFWELVAGATQLGATFHRIDSGLDTGAIIDSATVSLYATDTLELASDRAFELGRAVFERGLKQLTADPHIVGTPQGMGGTSNRQPRVGKRMSLGLRVGAMRVRNALSPRILAKTLASMFVLGIARPLRDLARTARGRHPVRIFTYHRVTSLCRDGMTISPAGFQSQMKYISKTHRIVSLDDALKQLSEGTKLSKPLAVIAFDDAYRSVYTQAAPILRSHGIVATCFASTGLLSTNDHYLHDQDCPAREFTSVMTWDELRELHREGWTVGSHTVSHARLSHCDQETLDHELGDSKTALEDAFGPLSLALAYPFGSRTDINERALATAKRLGYAACLGDFGGENFAGADPFALNRIDIGGGHSKLMWKLYANGYDLAKVRVRYSTK
jgi:peptidoglycan/xylan/chitin deacetylase (PgdA/CDA1 family)/folate-dependent phosphoribosylglycinamide formyltransferase PurN